eukprot:gene3565-3833_t
MQGPWGQQQCIKGLGQPTTARRLLRNCARQNIRLSANRQAETPLDVGIPEAAAVKPGRRIAEGIDHQADGHAWWQALPELWLAVKEGWAGRALLAFLLLFPDNGVTRAVCLDLHSLQSGTSMTGLITSGLTHSGLLAAVLNTAALFDAGRCLEAGMGSMQLISTSLMASVCAAVGHLVGGSSMLGVGGSGMVVGVYVAWVLQAKRHMQEDINMKELYIAAGVLVVLNLLLGMVQPAVGFASLAGGLLGGVLSVKFGGKVSEALYWGLSGPIMAVLLVVRLALDGLKLLVAAGAVVVVVSVRWVLGMESEKTNDPAWQALSTFMSHPCSSDIHVICKLLQTSHQFRQLLPQSHGVSITYPSWQRIGFRTFASQWLPKNGYLVRHLSIQNKFWALMPEPNMSIAAAARLISSGLQQAPSKAPANMPLQLYSFDSSVINTHDTLAALPAGSLTRLQLTCPNSVNRNSREWCKQLMQLSGLQQLNLKLTTSTGDTDKMLALLTSQVEPSLHRLSQLTHLDLSWFVPDLRLLQGLNKLPENLNYLKLDITISEFAFDISNLQPLDLQRLTNLQQLQLSVGGISAACPWQINPLPGHVTKLGLWFCDSWQSIKDLGILTLKQLQQLSFNCLCDHKELQQLSTLKSLTHLSLEHYSHAEALGAAKVWPQLSQLHCLTMDVKDGCAGVQPTEEEEEQLVRERGSIMQGISQATSLTKLDLWMWGFMGEDVAVCAMLKPLRGLQWLHLRVGCQDDSLVAPALLQSEDAIHLTALTAMTHLDLARAGTGVGDSAAALLCKNMPLLRHLDVSSCNLRAVAALQAMAELKQLTYLNVAGNAGPAKDDGVWDVFMRKKKAGMTIIGARSAGLYDDW